MSRRRQSIARAFAFGALALALAVAPNARAGADEPPNTTFSPRPPGTVTQSQLVYLAGQAMHSQWRAIASEVSLGPTAAGGEFEQWYLSIYAIDDTTYRLKYQSPANGAPLDLVTRVNGGGWYPDEDLTIVGSGVFEAPAIEQLVVQSYEAEADCGMGTVTIFAYDFATNGVRPVAVVHNYCKLSAAIVHGANADSILLTGPYYSSTAALCCPTTASVTATLRYAGGKWIETPQYFPIVQ